MIILLTLFWNSGYLSIYLFYLPTKEAHELREVVKRLKKLEDAQKATVDSCIDEIRHLVKSPMFTKDRALDYLLNLKIYLFIYLYSFYHSMINNK